MCHPKKIGTLPIEGRFDPKQTNEIGMFIPLLESIDIQGKDITADALLIQRKLASFVVGRQAHYHFTGKDNQATLKNDIALIFKNRKEPDFVEITPPDHGRIETRRIWCSTALNEHLDFPHVGKAWANEEGAKRPARARNARTLLSTFLNWCVTHPVYSEIVTSNTAQGKDVKRYLGKPVVKNDALTT